MCGLLAEWHALFAACECAVSYQGGTLPTVDDDFLARAAALLRERNAIDVELARFIRRPVTSGHLGAWIAAQVFDIELEASAARQLHSEQIMRGVKRGVASNLIKQQWIAAEIYLSSANAHLTVTSQQAGQLKLFAL